MPAFLCQPRPATVPARTIRQPTAGFGEVFPNPCRDRAVINYFLQSTGVVSLKLYDSEGRLAGILDAGSKPAGLRTVNMTVRNRASLLSPGVYFVRLESPAVRLTRKIAITQ